MSIGNEKRHRKRATRVRRANRMPTNGEPIRVATREKDLSAREHYRREKARRADRVREPEHPLEQARRAYHALLAADAERAKGGRPRKNAATPSRPALPSTEPDEEREE